MTCEEAVRHMRSRPEYQALVHDTYIGPDVHEAGERFARSGEFAEVLELLGSLARGKILDLGAGTGIASYAFARAGAAMVYAVEPDPSNEVGRGALERLTQGLNVKVIDAIGERLPLDDGAVDVVYCRQVLHHISDLLGAMRQCARILRPGGALLACREHVIDDPQQLQEFLANHPMHQLTGGENAYRLDEYLGAIRSAGLTIEAALGPWDSLINSFPIAQNRNELKNLPAIRLRERFGVIGRIAAIVPGVRSALWARYRRPIPGRLYTFHARKP